MTCHWSGNAKELTGTGTVRIYYTDNYRGGREESRSLLEAAFAAYTGSKEQAKKLTGALKKGEHGKPYIEGFSCFSVSHTGSIWAVLIADRECGLDIQLGKKCDHSAVAERWFAPEDSASIRSSDDFFRIWTRREALVKALGGTVYDPDLPAVSDDDLSVDGKNFIINDISIPEIPHLYAAMCVYAIGGIPELCFIPLCTKS